MRLLVIVLTFLLFVGIVGFVLTNLDTRVPVTVWETQYMDLPLFLLGIIAVFVGICYAGIIGVAEGASIRLANRRLAREVQRSTTCVPSRRRPRAPSRIRSRRPGSPRRARKTPRDPRRQSRPLPSTGPTRRGGSRTTTRTSTRGAERSEAG